MKIKIGFSPCPNDTFIFDALINKKIETGDLEFEAVLEDVQTLNEWAMKGKLDVTKISYGVLPLVIKEHMLLDSGGALGKGVGPLLISKVPVNEMTTVDTMRIAIPGKHTTAHMLFSLAFPNARNKQFMIFSGIEDSILNGEVDAGVIIHENRFTYQQKGLIKLMDLGEFWESKTGLPIPLGGIVVKRDLDTDVSFQINERIRQSIEYAFQKYPVIPEYVKLHSQEMSESVMRQHIDLYVNNYSIDLGKDGRKAVEAFLKVYHEVNKAVERKEKIFLAS